jgi:hypothetical protein
MSLFSRILSCNPYHRLTFTIDITTRLCNTVHYKTLQRMNRSLTKIYEKICIFTLITLRYNRRKNIAILNLFDSRFTKLTVKIVKIYKTLE